MTINGTKQQILLDIVDIGKRYQQIKKISLFGSRARGDNTASRQMMKRGFNC
ncbi:MAG: nucleotidyltransferase domain-containing protein [Candidatus Adiutrix sp.]